MPESGAHACHTQSSHRTSTSTGHLLWHAQGQAKQLTGLVVDCGHRTTCVTPVVEGYTIPSLAKAIPVGGAHITAYIQSQHRWAARRR